MLKKLLFLTSIFVSFETQCAPLTLPKADKVWKQTKQGIKRVVSTYPKIVRAMYLIKALINLHNSYFLSFNNKSRRLNFKESKITLLLPQKFYEAFTLESRLAVDARLWATPKDFDLTQNEILLVAKHTCFLCFKKNILSFVKWMVAALAVDYGLSKIEATQETEKETEI